MLRFQSPLSVSQNVSANEPPLAAPTGAPIEKITCFQSVLFNVSRIPHTNGQKESWWTFEETSVYLRPERVNKWPNSMTDI